MNTTLPICCIPTHRYLWLIQELPFPKVFAYITITICAIGVITNLLNIIVFSTKRMNCPINNILLYLAVSDFILSLSYVPFLYKRYLDPLFTDSRCLNLFWMVYFYATIMLYVWIRYASMWLRVLASVWRYIAIAYPLKCQVWSTTCRIHISVLIILLVFLVHSAIMIPLLLEVKVSSFTVYETGSAVSLNVTYYTYIRELGTPSLIFIFNMELIISIVFYHLIPSVTLFIVSIK